MKLFTFVTLLFLILGVFCDSKGSKIQENPSPSSNPQSRLQQLLQSVTDEVSDKMTDVQKQAFIDEVQTLVNGGRHIYQNPFQVNLKSPSKHYRA